LSAIDREQRKRVGRRHLGLRSHPKANNQPQFSPDTHDVTIIMHPKRMHKIDYSSENPVLLDPKEYEGGQLKGYNLRYYDPKAYAETGQGIEHEKAYPVEKKDEMLAFIKDELSGDLSSRAESSHKPRWTIQKVIEKDGRTFRPNVDVQEIAR